MRKDGSLFLIGLFLIIIGLSAAIKGNSGESLILYSEYKAMLRSTEAPASFAIFVGLMLIAAGVYLIRDAGYFRSGKQNFGLPYKVGELVSFESL